MTPRAAGAAKAQKPKPRKPATPPPPAKKKTAAKEKPKKAAKSTVPAVPALDYELLQIEPPEQGKELEWPPGLNSEQADALFRKMESGIPKSKAPAEVGLVWKTVFRWIRRYKDFADRIEEAALAGYQSMVDQIPSIGDTAVDKDTAAAARVKIDARVKYLQLTAPHRFAVKQINLGAGGASSGAAAPAAAPPGFQVGIILLPVKESGRGEAPSDKIIEGVSTVIRIPPKEQLPAPPRDT